jgi:gliding motility-associated-like protein
VVIAPATYLLDVENNFGCQTSDEIIVVEGCEPIIYIPTALNTQSTVGENRQLKVIYEHIDNEKLEIFNRWGELVYETNNLDIKWNGTVKGKVQSPTLYAYKLSYTSVDFPDRGILTEEGAVWVLR